MTLLGTPLPRRAVLGGAAAAGAATMLAKPAIAQTRTISFTLPWIVQGTSAYPFIGKEKGFFKSRGLDLNISRGFGSLPAAQAIATGQYEFGLVIAAPVILMIAKGLPLASIATVDYDATMGVGVVGDSPIRTPQDLAGKKIGTVVASAESPFFPTYAQRIGIDPKKVEMISLDPKVAERTLSDKQIDAMTGVAASSLPILLSRGVDARWMLYSSAGMTSYGTDVFTTPAILAKDPGLCGAVVDGLMESLAYTLTKPEESAEILYKAVPEIALNSSAKEFLRLGMLFHRFAIAKPAAMEHGLGWGNPAVYEQMTDLVMQYNSGPDIKRVPVDAWYTNRFAGNIKLSAADWTGVAKGVEATKKYLV